MNMDLDRKFCMAAAAAVLLLAPFAGDAAQDSKSPSTKGGSVELGQFSVSLAVKDLNKSQEFYEKLGFTRIAGSKPTDPVASGKAYAILQNGGAVIGLFQGMFNENILTFNPMDIRAVKAAVEKQGIAMDLQNMYGPLTDNSPAYAMLKDPDGNNILIDQHGPTK